MEKKGRLVARARGPPASSHIASVPRYQTCAESFAEPISTNAAAPISSMPVGMSMRRSPVQPENAWFPSVRMLSGREREASCVQEANAPPRITASPSGKETSRTLRKPENAFAPTVATPSQTTTRSRVPTEWSQGRSLRLP